MSLDDCKSWWGRVEARFRNSPDDLDTLCNLLRKYTAKIYDETQLYVTVYGHLNATGCCDLMPGFRKFLPKSWDTKELEWLDEIIRHAQKDKAQWERVLQQVGLSSTEEAISRPAPNFYQADPLPIVVSSSAEYTLGYDRTPSVLISDAEYDELIVQDSPDLTPVTMSRSASDIRKSSRSIAGIAVKSSALQFEVMSDGSKAHPALEDVASQRDTVLEGKAEVKAIIAALKKMSRPKLSIIVPPNDKGQVSSPQFSPLTPPLEVNSQSSSTITCRRKRVTLSTMSDTSAILPGLTDKSPDAVTSAHTSQGKNRDGRKTTNEAASNTYEDFPRPRSDSKPPNHVSNARRIRTKVTHGSASSVPDSCSTEKSKNKDMNSVRTRSSTSTRLPLAADVPLVGSIYSTRKALLNRENELYIHAICGKRFRSVEDIRQHHFGTSGTGGCRDPNGFRGRDWDHHPSCKIQHKHLNTKGAQEGYVSVDQESVYKVAAANDVGASIRTGEEDVRVNDDKMMSTSDIQGDAASMDVDRAVQDQIAKSMEDAQAGIAKNANSHNDTSILPTDVDHELNESHADVASHTRSRIVKVTSVRKLMIGHPQGP